MVILLPVLSCPLPELSWLGYFKSKFRELAPQQIWTCHGFALYTTPPTSTQNKYFKMCPLVFVFQKDSPHTMQEVRDTGMRAQNHIMEGQRLGISVVSGLDL
jgi:hypothetical protein